MRRTSRTWSLGHLERHDLGELRSAEPFESDLDPFYQLDHWHLWNPSSRGRGAVMSGLYTDQGPFLGSASSSHATCQGSGEDLPLCAVIGKGPPLSI